MFSASQKQDAFDHARQAIALLQSSSTLEDCIDGWKEEVESNAIQVHISDLRRKLRADNIETVRRVEYVVREE
ncbi:helix-turn-helix domain-containing protein [Paraburkholderia kirstenboschensis]|jgi:DNA-binding response OmpR family regulator|uniref:Helix-turn-helix domain-containing protein n=1 Tax=Paraburkholderia kirstenboschensis TaxID=1245436 RepID=A0ABZ0EEW2_9BURK|nr:helix-turn-helix domain-containing protein [Paraburkholderia kirstenboschensis]WOD14737.1 helix-turn-helix domain-containing protein [Paraburkholderia kirstenboschensis]